MYQGLLALAHINNHPVTSCCGKVLYFCQSAKAASVLERVTGQVPSDRVLGHALAGAGKKAVDSLFTAAHPSASHRLREAKRLMRVTEPRVLDFLVGWRKVKCWVYTNSFAQCYVLHEAWKAILDMVPGVSHTKTFPLVPGTLTPLSLHRWRVLYGAMVFTGGLRYCHSRLAPRHRKRS